MKLILFCMNQEGSPHFASFKFARELTEYGFRVVYVGFRFFEPLVLLQEFEYVAIDDGHAQAEGPAGPPAKNSFEATDRKIRDVFCRFMEQWLVSNAPDLAIIDNIRLFDFSIPFHKRGIPIVGFGSNLSSAFSIQYPPVTSHLVPGRLPAWLSPAANLLAWAGLYLGRLGWHLRSWLEISRFVHTYGGDYEWGEYGYKLKVPNIIAITGAFNFPDVSWPGRNCVIGASVDLYRVGSRPVPLRLDKNKQLVYCSLGTHRYVTEKYAIHFFNSVIEAVRARPHLQLVLHVREEETDKLHDVRADGDIMVYSWLPQLDVLSRSALFITHGGLGSVRESIYLGVPMLVFPLAVDQPGNAARVVRHGLGLRGNIRRVNAPVIGKMIDECLGSEAIRRAAQGMRRHSTENLGPAGIAFLEDIMAQREAVASPNLRQA